MYGVMILLNLWRCKTTLFRVIFASIGASTH